jgi:hypothetical protein
MEEVDDAGFEDFSVSNTLEKVAFAVEQATERWLLALAGGKELVGVCPPGSSARGFEGIQAVEGARHAI